MRVSELFLEGIEERLTVCVNKSLDLEVPLDNFVVFIGVIVILTMQKRRHRREWNGIIRFLVFRLWHRCDCQGVLAGTHALSGRQSRHRYTICCTHERRGIADHCRRKTAITRNVDIAADLNFLKAYRFVEARLAQ